MNFRCYSEFEDMERCESQCEFCKKEYERPETKYDPNFTDNLTTSTQDSVLGVRVPPEIRHKLDQLMKMDHKTMSGIILTMILNELKEIDYKFKTKK